MRDLLAASFLFLAGCSLVLDTDRHQGGDRDGGGDASDPCDVDRDGYRAISCGGPDCDDLDAKRYPAAPAICGDSVVEACPGSIPFTSTDLFPANGELGTLPIATIREGGTLGEGVAVAAVPLGDGGFGTASVFTLDLRGGSTMRPLRLDVPLGTPSNATTGRIDAQVDGSDLSLTTDVTSVDARTLTPPSGGEIGVHYVDSAVGRTVAGVVDHAGGSSSFESYVGSGSVLDEPGVMDRIFVSRRVLPGVTELFSRTFDGPALAPSYVTENVPTANPIRLVTTDSRFFMLQDGAGTFWFAGAYRDTMDPAQTVTISTQAGKAAWVAGSTQHALAYRAGTRFVFHPYACQTSGPAICIEDTGTIQYFTLAAMDGEVFDGKTVANGHRAFLLSRRYEDGDELLLQLVTESLIQPVGSPLVLLSLRPSGDRIVDARMDVVDGSVADSLVASVLVRTPTTPAGRSDRLLVVGLRSCLAP